MLTGVFGNSYTQNNGNFLIRNVHDAGSKVGMVYGKCLSHVNFMFP